MPRALTDPKPATRRHLHRLLAGAAGAVALSVSPAARAQADLSPPLPNVLLLVDTSGSMEFKTNGDPPVCNPNQPNLQNDRSRWIDLVEVMTGTIQNYSCEAVSRSTAAFVNEYKFGALDPYDFLYSLPYHRPLSNGCGPGAGTHFTGATNPFIWPASNAIGFHRYNWGASCNNFSQIANDGILDSYKTLIRFALMTFDSAVSEETGFTSGPTPDFAGGREGLWSYVVGNHAVGKPYGCEGPPPAQEVGARNAAAPPWEGRLINFGHPDDGKRAYETKNAQIQQVLLATRPFGATPIAGMLRDAYDFLLNDKTKDRDLLPGVDPASKEADFGPWQDPYLSCSRDRAVLLLTDGQPNMDLRPSCVAPNGNDDLCPFDPAEEIAAALKDKGIPTYVVGFALDQATQDNTTKSCDQVDCSSVDYDSAGALQACCTLRKIAVAGGGTASFASNKAALRSQIQKILGRRVNTTSRTQPAVGNSSGTGSVRFFSGFIPGLGGDETTAGRPWSGVLDRQRWICEADPLQGNILVPKPQPVEEEEGDKFVWNVAQAGPDNRAIYTYIGGNGTANDIFSRRTMRPMLEGTNPNDGAGSYGAQVFARLSQSFATAIEPKALEIPPSDCVFGATSLDANACRNHYLKWLLGYSNGTEYHRCPSAGAECELIGDIFHSTPQIVGPPAALTRDESYARFAFEKAERPAVLYTSSNDGFLHAFRVDTDGGENNELWAFIPPATLPNLYTQYPHSHQFLLDGVPIITDVVAFDDPNEPLPVVFERSEGDAAGDSNTWRTVLVQSFGGEHSGYFALDVTDPVPNTSSLQDPTKGGPRLLWQLTDDADGVNLFGRGGATPAITTLFFDPEEGGNDPREIPVAVLPGGPGGTVVAGESDERTFPADSIDEKYVPRKRVRKYSFPASELGARSLTIVRIDTGEIIRTFRQDDAEIANADLKKRVIEVKELDSPVTGQPVAFPGIVGAVADRIYVGDNDGRLWKVDVSSRDPSEWRMKLFFDTYPATLNGTNSGLTSASSQPIMTVPVLSVDEIGNVTVNIATGDQDRLGSDADQRNFVWSLTDKINPADLSSKATVNWYRELSGGDRAVGPLALFNGNLYFASFRPATAGEKACHAGRSSVWGMHYLTPKTANTPGDGGAPAPNFPNQFIEQSSDAVVFGVSVVQQPSCYAVDDEAAGDQFLGFGSQRRFTNVQPGQFQLVMHMGHTAPGTGNTNVTNSSVSSSTIDLAQPNSLSQVTGWASVLE